MTEIFWKIIEVMARPKRFELLTPRFVVCRLGPITSCEVVEALTRKQS